MARQALAVAQRDKYVYQRHLVFAPPEDDILAGVDRWQVMEVYDTDHSACLVSYVEVGLW